MNSFCRILPEIKIRGEIMIRQIIINEVTLQLVELEERKVINESTGNEIIEIQFKLITIGKNNYHLINNLITSGRLSVDVPSTDLKFVAKLSSSSISYQSEMDEKTEVTISATLREVEEEDADDPLVNITVQEVRNTIRLTAVSELLIEKGVLTNEELEEKLNVVYKRDAQEITNRIWKVKQ